MANGYSTRAKGSGRGMRRQTHRLDRLNREMPADRKRKRKQPLRAATNGSVF